MARGRTTSTATPPCEANPPTSSPPPAKTMAPTASRRVGTPLKKHRQPTTTPQPRPPPPPSQGDVFRKKNDAGGPSPPNLAILGFHPGPVGGGQRMDHDVAFRKGNNTRSIANIAAAVASQGIPPIQSPSSHQHHQPATPAKRRAPASQVGGVGCGQRQRPLSSYRHKVPAGQPKRRDPSSPPTCCPGSQGWRPPASALATCRWEGDALSTYGRRHRSAPNTRSSRARRHMPTMTRRHA